MLWLGQRFGGSCGMGKLPGNLLKTQPHLPVDLWHGNWNKISKTKVLGYKKDCKIYSAIWYCPAHESLLHFSQNTSYSEVTVPAHSLFCIILALQYMLEWITVIGKQRSRILKIARLDWREHWHIKGAIFFLILNIFLRFICVSKQLNPTFSQTSYYLIYNTPGAACFISQNRSLSSERVKAREMDSIFSASQLLLTKRWCRKSRIFRTLQKDSLRIHFFQNVIEGWVTCAWDHGLSQR